MYSQSNQSQQSQPILVTGAHRSGTTWVGKMLTAGGEAAYISEPLNVWHRPGVMGAPVERWYTYICPQNEDLYLTSLCQTLQLRYHTWDEIRSLRSRKDLLRMGRDWSIFLLGRIRKQRTLLKDPFAVFAAPWFARRLGCRIVVTVRHPAAFASSLKRLGWHFDFSHLLEQPLLMQDWLAPFRGDMEAMLQTPQDVIGQAALLWRMIYQAVNAYRGQIPDLHIVRHEDLSIQPLPGFQALYASLGLEFTGRARNTVLNSSSSENPAEGSQKAIYAVRLDSRANLQNWKRRLDAHEIGRIRSLTEAVAASYYPDLDWD